MMNGYTQILVGYLMNLELWGALCGLAGTIIIFFFGFPPNIDPEGNCYLLLEQGNEAEISNYKKYKNTSYLGLSFIALSFLIQIIVITQK